MQEETPSGALVAERHGAHVLVHAGDEADRERSFLAGLPPTPGDVLVLASQAAYRDPALAASLVDLLSPVLDGDGGGNALWLAVNDLAADPSLLERLSTALGRDVLAPAGPLTVLPGSGIHVGPGPDPGGTGWWRTRSDVPAWLFGTRFPVPRWQAALPSRAFEAGGAVAEPVLAGLAVRDAQAPPVGPGAPAFATALDVTSLLVVVGGAGPVPAPASVAAVLTRLPPGAIGRIVLVPGNPAVAADDWLGELAGLLGRDVVTATGARLRSPAGEPATIALNVDGRPGFRPFATVLRRRPGGGPQEVVDVSAPPPGWVRSGERSYAPAGAEGAVRADVVPGGLVLQSAASAVPVADVEPFDPTGWTLTVGAASEPVGDDLLAAAEQLLAGLGARQRAAARVRLGGPWEGSDPALLERVVPGVAPAGQDDDAAGESGGIGESGEIGGAAADPGPPPVPVVIPDWSATASAIVTTSATPPSSVTTREAESVAPPEPGPPAPDVPPAGPAPASHGNGDGGTPAPAAGDPAPVTADLPDRIARADDRGTGRPGVDDQQAPVAGALPAGGLTTEATGAAVVTGRPAAATQAAATQDAGATAAGATAETAGPVPPAPAQDDVPPTAGPSAVPGATPPPTPSAVPERPSTAAEQNRFAAAAGEPYGDALATVNAALATWPALRQDGGGAKPDLVAVCLFLGRGDTGATEVNDAVRGGRGGVVDGHLPCLVSGIRRLPSHRRAVLRQSTSRVPEPDTVGRYFTEPGFLSASMNLDVTVPDAGLDVLIWPTTARRTTELRTGRPVDEAVFLAGARFKALAVRTADEAESEPDVPEAPRTAVLVRELAPGEPPSGTGLDARDLAALAKLDRALAQRQHRAVRLVDDPDAVDRLTTEWTELAVAPQAAAAGAGS